MAGALSMFNIHSASILRQQLDKHLRDIQMHFLCKKKKKKKNHDRHMSKRLHMFQMSHVFFRCICSLKGPWPEVPECSAAYIDSESRESTLAPVWIHWQLQKGCFYCVSLLINWNIVTCTDNTNMVPNDWKSDLMRTHPSFIYVGNNKLIFAQQVHMPKVCKLWCIHPQPCWK